MQFEINGAAKWTGKKSPNSLQKKSEGEKKTIKKDFSYLFHLLINPK